MRKLDRLFLIALLGGAILTLILFFMPTSISDYYTNPEIYDTGFNYYLWKFRAIDQNTVARVTAWLFFFLHFGVVAYLLGQLSKHRSERKDGYTVYNIYLLVANAFFILLHYIHTMVWYDALAQDTPVWSSQGSVIIMLVLVLIIENRRRGLFFGKKLPFPKESTKTIMKYHGIYITLATVFTFWYHPMENTPWHIVGFLYMYLLFIQMSFARTKIHQNKYFNLTLEVMVLFHGTSVALYSGNAPWSMFLFGFAAIFFVTQIYGIGISKKWIHLSQVVFVLLALGTYSGIFNNRQLYEINEVFRIPFIEYFLVFVFVYVIYVWIKIPLKKWIKNIIMSIFLIIVALYSVLVIYTMSSYYPEPEMNSYLVDVEGLDRVESNGSIVYEFQTYETHIVLVPGGKVIPVAYEYLAYNIAKEGYKVTIVKTPFQLAILNPYQANKYFEEDKENIIIGHSLGGVVASMNASKEDYDALIIMGSYPIADVQDVETVLLVGSEENLLDNQKYQEAQESLTNGYEHIIEGGNHAYFGYYGEQKGDNDAILTNKEQQDYVIGFILDFID